MHRRRALAAAPLIVAGIVAPSWGWPGMSAKPVRHVQNYGALQCDGVLSVVFDLETYDRKARAWAAVRDDGAAVVQVSITSPNYWTTLVTGSGGENHLRAAHPDDAASPGNLSVRVVHRGVASSPRVADHC